MPASLRAPSVETFHHHLRVLLMALKDVEAGFEQGKHLLIFDVGQEASGIIFFSECSGHAFSLSQKSSVAFVDKTSPLSDP
ncbi:MAG: hypothetical protein AAF414_06820, partial [Pseudomonadota bacterium]